MFSKPLYGKRIAPACEYCQLGKMTADGEYVLCPRKGAVALSDSCRRFRYDILARTPKRPLSLGHFNPEDFSLE